MDQLSLFDCDLVTVNCKKCYEAYGITDCNPHTGKKYSSVCLYCPDCERKS